MWKLAVPGRCCRIFRMSHLMGLNVPADYRRKPSVMPPNADVGRVKLNQLFHRAGALVT